MKDIPERREDGNWIRNIKFRFPLPILRDGKEVVRVDGISLDKEQPDELDLTCAESKATYEEIKAYVAEHNDGMQVSNLYIAQVKAKYGIKERANYNLPKLEDVKQPHCPKEKEDAIVEALRFFHMI